MGTDRTDDGKGGNPAESDFISMAVSLAPTRTQRTGIGLLPELPDVIAEPGQVHRRKPHCGSTSGLIAHRSCHALSGVP